MDMSLVDDLQRVGISAYSDSAGRVWLRSSFRLDGAIARIFREWKIKPAQVRLLPRVQMVSGGEPGTPDEWHPVIVTRRHEANYSVEDGAKFLASHRGERVDSN